MTASALLCLCLTLAGCAGANLPSSPALSSSVGEPATSSSSPIESKPPPAPELPEPEGDEAPGNAYLNGLIADTIAKFATPDMTEYEKAKAAFDYMIANTILDEPIGLDLWRTHGESKVPLTFVENRSVSVLQYGVGMCEDYAATFTMLLRGLGLEAEYVPGLTYSLEGHLVDHAWVVAKIDGIWYHLDCQLEDNVSRRNTIRYRYFMKSDATMAGSHRWGQNLLDAGLLNPEQATALAQRPPVPLCPQDSPAPAPQIFDAQPALDIPALTAGAQAEIDEYERANGALPPLTLDIIPPVFGPDGYGPQDEG